LASARGTFQPAHADFPPGSNLGQVDGFHPTKVVWAS
jgi:hypothetical protein